AAGTRWASAPAAGTAWLPASVDFAAGGELVFAAGALGSPGWMVFPSSQLAPAGTQLAPWFSVAADPATLSNMSVRCGDLADELFGLAQVPDPDSTHRRTEVSR